MPAVPRTLRSIAIADDEIEVTAIRAQGAGGQNVNKVSSAVHLRFNIPASSLPEDLKERLLACRDGRITQEGVLIIKAQTHRRQEMNRADAMRRLQELVDSMMVPPRIRRATKPSDAAKQRRLAEKIQRSQLKITRRKVID